MRRFLRLPLLLLAGGALAACGDDGPTGPTLTPAEVADRYAVCSLVFDPEGDVLPQVDVRAAAFEADNPVTQAGIGLNATRTFELEYTPEGQNTDVELPGNFTISGTTVDLRFTSATAASAILLPQSVRLAFQAAPKQLSVTRSDEYEVPRSDYARLAGISESGLAERIPGRLQASFRVGGC